MILDRAVLCECGAFIPTHLLLGGLLLIKNELCTSSNQNVIVGQYVIVVTWENGPVAPATLLLS